MTSSDKPPDSGTTAGLRPAAAEMLRVMDDIARAQRYIDGKMADLARLVAAERPAPPPAAAMVVAADSTVEAPPTGEEPRQRLLMGRFGMELAVGVVAAVIALGIVVFMFTGGYR